MSALAWGVVIGVGGWILLGVVVGCVVDREIREGLARIVLFPFAAPLLALTELGMKLPMFKRNRVTPESLRQAMDDQRFDSQTYALGWPWGALVLLRSKRKDEAS